ncbi:hypothetical protein FKM82_028210 [Ascaphus truei]
MPLKRRFLKGRHFFPPFCLHPSLRYLVAAVLRPLTALQGHLYTCDFATKIPPTHRLRGSSHSLPTPSARSIV